MPDSSESKGCNDYSLQLFRLLWFSPRYFPTSVIAGFPLPERVVTVWLPIIAVLGLACGLPDYLLGLVDGGKITVVSMGVGGFCAEFGRPGASDNIYPKNYTSLQDSISR